MIMTSLDGSCSLAGFLILFAVFSFSFAEALVKQLDSFPVWGLVWWRSFFGLLLSSTFLMVFKAPFQGKHYKLLALRGIFGTLGFMLLFWSIQHIPLATANVLQKTAPPFALGLAPFILKEKTHPLIWIFFLTSFIGVLFIKGFDARVSFLALAAGLLCGLFSGLAYNIVRLLRGREHPLTIIFYFNVVSFLMTSYFFIQEGALPYGKQWIYLAGIGVLSFIAQISLTKGLQLAPMDQTIILGYAGSFFSLMIGYFLFQETIPLMALLGMLIILVSTFTAHYFQKKRTVV